MKSSKIRKNYYNYNNNNKDKKIKIKFIKNIELTIKNINKLI